VHERHELEESRIPAVSLASPATNPLEVGDSESGEPISVRAAKVGIADFAELGVVRHMPLATGASPVIPVPRYPRSRFVIE
jgi:hypothetical protein